MVKSSNKSKSFPKFLKVETKIVSKDDPKVVSQSVLNGIGRMKGSRGLAFQLRTESYRVSKSDIKAHQSALVRVVEKDKRERWLK